MASLLHPNLQQPSLSLTKIHSGSRLQSPSLSGAVSSNVSADFFRRVNKSLRGRIRNTKPRGAVNIMAYGRPRTFVKTPGEDSYQLVDIMDALYNKRVIFINQEIDDYYSNHLLGTMLYLDSIDDTSRLNFYLNGPGGDLHPCLTVYDGIKALRSPISTLCIGGTYNMATFMLAAGGKGFRSATPHCIIALEPPAGPARGQADTMRIEADELVRIKNYVYKEFSKNTGQPVEKIEKNTSKGGLQLGPREAIEYGIIDKIVRPPRIVNDSDDSGPANPSVGLG